MRGSSWSSRPRQITRRLGRSIFYGDVFYHNIISVNLVDSPRFAKCTNFRGALKAELRFTRLVFEGSESTETIFKGNNDVPTPLHMFIRNPHTFFIQNDEIMLSTDALLRHSFETSSKKHSVQHRRRAC